MKAAIALLATLIHPALASAANLDLDPRSFSMGSTFAAAADDVASIYHNPAGIASLGSLEARHTIISQQHQRLGCQ